MNLKELIAARGYLKGTITRLLSLTSTNISSVNKETLLSKRQRLIDAFKQYKSTTIKILSLDSDTEDDEKVEENYFSILYASDHELNSRNNPSALPVSKLHLPPIDVPIFTGKFQEFVPFINLFKSLIDQNDCIDDVQKLHYLRSYLRNDYKKALHIINDRYNNKHKLINDHICILLDLKPITKSTSAALREFVSNVKQGIAALCNLDPNVNGIILCILYRKLDAYTSRAFQMERDASKEPTIDTFLDYLEKRALALENADPGFHGQHRQQQGSAARGLVANIAAQEPACLYCADTFRAAGAACSPAVCNRGQYSATTNHQYLFRIHYWRYLTTLF
ncbi:hypothetical protein ABMA27_010439 [Loxostege sticticalis]|uniref:Uncharacterized protein n=1 Tax=Loxostege sticticalis TaxID=481309 RepID=A0ABR3H5P6_LOXSC